MFLSTRRFIVASYLCSVVLAALALAEDAMPATAEAPVAAPAPVAPAALVPSRGTKRREPRIVHPQVNLAGFSREYRAMPVKCTPADAAIRRALREPAPKHWDFREVPLRAVLSQIGDDVTVSVVPDVQALSDAGLDLDASTVTLKVPEGMSLDAALRLILRDLGLTWIVGDEALTVTTRDKAQENLVVVAYPLPRGFDGSQPVDFQPTMDLVMSTVAPATWDSTGGPGSMKPIDASGAPLLVVSQTCEVHDEVENLLRRIHGEVLAEFDGRRPVLRAHHVNGPAARTSLADSLKGVCNDSLGDAGDQDAAVKVVGESVVVLSKSPEFHALAAQVIAAVDGVPEQEPRSPYAAGFGMTTY